MRVLACVMNVSEGRSSRVVDALRTAAGNDLLDIHVDRHHHRTVLWLVGEDAPRAIAVEAVARIDLRRHCGAHPRLGAVDVVPFVPIDTEDLADAQAARDRFASWITSELRVPAFLYGSERSLPEIRRGAFRSLHPEAGARLPHPTAGAAAIGARPPLVAYNLWLDTGDLAVAREIARSLRGPMLRALGIRVGSAVQVSMNLVDPLRFGPADAYDAVGRVAPIGRAELVGLLPAAVLERVPPSRWAAGDQAGEPARANPQASERPLPPYPAALPFAHAPPNAEFLTVGEGVLEALVSNHAAPAYFLGLLGGGASLGKEEVGVDPEAVGEILPTTIEKVHLGRRVVHVPASLAAPGCHCVLAPL